MNRQAIPSVFASKDKEYLKRFTTATEISKRVHVDVMDGVFVSASSPTLSMLPASPRNELDFHLMVKKPEQYLTEMKRLGARRAYVHVEIGNPTNVISAITKIKDAGIEVHAAFNPETNADEIIPLAVHIDGCLLMAHEPGIEGRAFITGTHRKIREISRIIGDKEITIDGGINKDVAAKLRESNANIIVVGSAVAASQNPLEQLKGIREVFER